MQDIVAGHQLRASASLVTQVTSDGRQAGTLNELHSWRVCLISSRIMSPKAELSTSGGTGGTAPASGAVGAGAGAEQMPTDEGTLDDAPHYFLYSFGVCSLPLHMLSLHLAYSGPSTAENF